MTNKRQKNRSGFTIVELVISIAVIGILSTVISVSYTGWREKTAETEVKNDLLAIKSALESSRNFSDTYPSSVPSTYSGSSGVAVMSYTSNGDTYCVIARSKKITSVSYVLKSSTDPVKGTSCS